MFKKTLLAALVSGVMISGVQAAEIQPNGYLFGNVGQASYDFGSAYDGAPGSLDDEDTAFKIGAGIQLNRFVGVEFQYLDLGEATYQEPGFKQIAEVEGYGANLVGTIPVDRFKLYGKVGYHKLELDFTEKEVGWLDWNESEKDWVTSYAVGATFALTPQFEIAAEYERYDDVADKFDVNVDVDLASIGLRYNF
ncbi:porin family protein [Pseudomonas sp. gcc21]|uniref:porin family protein n=1 Tax=Pseudomonas sp. gcc21 TaxID=2726989 RepID=UPI001451A451|nr:porin family protein [Pseudomonas sp. gcc21]QJD60199.1 porin family protein [Pseudomonas sp. gcc21]